MMNFMKWLLILFFLIPSLSFSFCYEPSPPWSKPSKPSVPWCVNEWNNTHTCDDWEIEAYNDSINTYNYEVEIFIMELQNYLDAARTYANCEIETLN